jgi:hypothetical protein
MVTFIMTTLMHTHKNALAKNKSEKAILKEE